MQRWKKGQKGLKMCAIFLNMFQPFTILIANLNTSAGIFRYVNKDPFRSGNAFIRAGAKLARRQSYIISNAIQSNIYRNR